MAQWEPEYSAKISGTVECNGNGILMLAIPDQEGWHIYLDGEEQRTYNSNYGFIGIGVSEGEHLVEAEYNIPKLREGLFVSLIGIVSLILFMLSTLKIYYDKRNE